jgi:PHD/YefM family antitoxin component YafN of YafNO toxin-antitoxin module
MKAQVLEKDGKKEFVILAWEDYIEIQEMLEDYEDLRELRKAKEESRGQKPIPFEKVVKSLKLRR